MKSFSARNPVHTPTIAIVGCGAIAESFYLPALVEQLKDGGRLMLVDSNRARVEAVAHRYQVSTYATDYRELLGSVDAVVIAVPHHLHFAISRDFLTLGVHVLCEKPLAEDSARAREMVRLANEHGAVLAVNNTRRLLPSNSRTRELIMGGEIGNVLSIRYEDGGEFNWPTATGFYFDSKISTRGVLLDIGAHVFDLVCWWLGGKPDIVSSESDSFGGCEAVSSVFMRLSDCRIQIRLSRLSRLKNRFLVEGDRGTIEGEVYNWRRLWLARSNQPRRQINLNPREELLQDFGRTLVSNFLAVLRMESGPLISASDVLPSLELIDTAYEKATRFAMPWYDTEVVNG